MVHAQSAQYTYDVHGRVVATTQANGTSAAYTYDALGNVVQVSSVPAGQLAIFALVPSHGEAGTKVTIAGQGFSTSAANDTVSFNGTVATVLSATATQLTVSVPGGATTGPVSVTVGSQTATSPESFTIDDTGEPPSISQVSPTLAAAGNIVTVSGAHLNPVAGDTTVQMGGNDVALASLNDAQFQYTVSSSSVSGHVTVQTPYGAAISAAPVVVLPNGISASNVVSSGYAPSNGASVSLNIGAAGQIGLMTFDGTSGEWISLQASAITTSASSIAYTVYAPGNTVVQQGTVSTAAPSIHLPALPKAGTYVVTFQPNTAGAQLTVTLEVNAQVALSSPATFVTSVANQSKRVLFQATQGQDLELTLNGLQLAGASYNEFDVRVYNSVGAQVAYFACYPGNPGASCSQHLWYLAAGTYSVMAIPDNGGTMTFSALIQPDVVGPAIAMNGSASMALNAGQVERLTFNANAGDTVALNVPGVTTTPAGQAVTFTVYRPDAGAITTATSSYTSFSATGSQTVNLPTLPVSGTYTVIASPSYGLPANTQLSVMSGATGSVHANGTSQSYAANVAGENVYVSFTATQGENLELTLNNAKVAGATYNEFDVYVYNSAGARVAYFPCYPGNPGASCTQHLWYLPAGTYSVVAVPDYGGVISFNALLQDDIVGPAITSTSSASVALNAGQVERLTFNANAGDTVALNVSGITTTPAGQNIQFRVYRPDAGAITTGTPVYTAFNPTGSQTVNLPKLPISGTYTVIVAPSYGLPANTQVSLISGETGTVAANSAAQSYAANVTGENVYLSFTATQGENLELTLNNAKLTGASYNEFDVYVYNSAGAQVAYLPCYPGNPGASCTQHLWYLPAGTYSVVAIPDYGGVISFNALLEDDITGPTVAAGSSANIALNAGQVERLTFNANTGDTVALNVSGVTTTPTGQPVNIYVYRPDAGAITTGTPSYTVLSPTAAQTVNLSKLPVSGAYTVIVAPSYGLPATAQLSVAAGETGTVAANGTSQAYIANVTGENVYLSFTATQGENLELTLNQLQLTGATYNEFDVYVYNSTGAQVAYLPCYPGNPGASCTQHLWSLRAGTYSIVAIPDNGGVIRFNALLQDDIIGPAIASGGSANVALNAGQVERLSFNANAGDTVTLNVSGVATTPSGLPVNVLVYRPDVGGITNGTPAYSALSPTSSQSLSLQNLPVTGAYTVIVEPSYGLAANAQVGVSNVAGTPPTYGTATLPSNGTAQNESTAQAGQSVTMTFNANPGDNLELTLSGLTVTGSSNWVTMTVTNPSGTVIASNNNCNVPNPGGRCSLSLWNLQAGTYTVVVSPPSSNMQMSFSLALQPDVAGPALSANTPATVTLGTGQVERLTFNANVGDTVALSLSGVSTTTPSGQPVYVSVYRPDTGAMTTSNYYTQFSAASFNTINLPNLPASGTYTVVVSSAYGTPGTAQLTLSPGITGTLPSDGTIQSYATSAPGQNVYTTFTAHQGDNLELTMSGLTTTVSNWVTMTVYNASGVNIATNNNCNVPNPGGRCTLSLWNLPAGTYSVVVTPPSVGMQMSFGLSLQPDVVGPTLSANTPTTVTLNAGQVERLTFNANAGDTMALNLSGVSTTTPSGQPVYVSVYRPDTGAITTGNYYTQFAATGSNMVNLSNLPASGTYTVVVSGSYGTPGTAQVTLTPGVVGSALSSNGVVQNYATSAPGQNVYTTFTANQGDNLELTMSGLTTSVSNWVTMTVYNASGVNIASNDNCNVPNPGGRCTLSLWNLPAGTYSVVVTPPSVSMQMSFGLSLQPDTVGPALSANTPTTVTLGAGQVERLTFNANVGDSVALNVSGVSTTNPASQAIYVNVYRPDTGAITPSNYYTSFAAGSSNTINLADLPASGTYTLVVYGSYGTPGTGQITLTPVARGSLSGSFQSYSTNVPGQNIYATFTANQGDNLELTMSGLTVTGGTNWVTMTVYNANGVNIASNDNCNVPNPGGSCNLPLWNLLAGTYTVVVTPPSVGMQMNFNLSLQADIDGPALVMNVPSTVALGAGQVERVTFNANQGDKVTLNLTNASTSMPSGQPVYVTVYRPDVGAITPSNYYTTLGVGSSNTIRLPSAPVSGTYTAIVSTAYGIPGTIQMTDAQQ